ncbi:hypothetical protein [Methylobacterium oxalidis]|uniref:Uncharacterized protein n=1 Tax=Methylobacterium oxalidis TaxID=944322 RepID=A0A512J6K6_9HYPH|nr:hypothetical protein [Methylobacterium oxalidis]GEP05614.1 hypothetical protein MOX02_36520 [Methylobacterium oxalidis]GJE35496.1 hypothetical protein LDDCCGHA_5714 [Methylobacterium oxalidis]GLS65406.1 hypothetical protein GCM10007888_37880 [Methylobacterium oxalidis]
MQDLFVTHRSEDDTPEPTYRAVVVDAQNAVVSVDTLQATQLEEAATLAREMAATSTVYLWDGPRFIQRFQPEDR